MKNKTNSIIAKIHFLFYAAIFVLICTILPTQVEAADYYVSVSGAGSRDGSSVANAMTLNEAKQNANPGDTFLLQPGNYGSFVLDGGYGTESNWVTYKADPITTTPRGANWYEGDLDRPDETKHVIFSGITLISNKLSEGVSKGHYIIIDGVYVLEGNVKFGFYTANVTIRNCSIFQK